MFLQPRHMLGDGSLLSVEVNESTVKPDRRVRGSLFELGEITQSTFKTLGCIGGPVFEFRHLPLRVFESLTVTGKMSDARFESR